MRDDLTDAIASVDCGEAQFPVFQAHIREWIYRVQTIWKYSDYDPTKKLAIVRMKPIGAIINAELGMIINAFRTALDILAASLARRNGVRPTEDTHFPIFHSLHDFLDPKDGIESKKWLSASDIKTIKALDPYNGGHEFLYAIHKLDIVRKHERLIRTVGGLLSSEKTLRCENSSNLKMKPYCSNSPLTHLNPR
jgi:hypothetical protein